jgi:outer membrane protein assembly factor BamB
MAKTTLVGFLQSIREFQKPAMNKIFHLLLPLFIVTGTCDAQKKVSSAIKKPTPFKIRKPAPMIKYEEPSKKKAEVGEPANIGSNAVHAEKRDAKFNQYSNNAVLSANDIVLNNLILKVDTEKKITGNALLIYGSNGKIFSYDLDRQTINWRYLETGITSSGSNRFNVNGATLYVPYIDGTLAALDVNTGSVYWKDKIGLRRDKSLLTRQNATINNDQIFIAARNSNLYAINKKNGSMAWNYELQYEFNIYPPVIIGDGIYINNAPYIYKFQAQTGKPAWQRNFTKAMYASMVADGKRLYATDESNTLYAINPDADSSIDWEFKLSDNQYGVGENIIIDKGTIYMAGKANPDSKATSIYGISAADGKQLWKTDLAKDEVVSLNMIDGQIYGYMKDNLFTIDPEDGKLLHSVKPPEEPISNIIRETETSLLYLSQNGLVRISKIDKNFKLIPVSELKTDEPESKANIQLVTKDN